MTQNRPLLWSALLAGGGLFVLLNIWGMLLMGGVFVYPLNDTYIHLSMAEQIARGEYGINPQAFSAAASSILYLVLLIPFVGSAFQQFMPLLINAAALVWGLVLIERILSKSGFLANKSMRNLMLFILLVAPVSMNVIGVAMLGMEQILHVLMVLFAIYGVVLWQEEKRVNAYLLAAILLGPLIGYEAMGLSLLLSFMIFIEGKRPAGAVLVLAALLPVIAFSWFLYANDGSFLPNSVIRKVGMAKSANEQDVLLLLKNFNAGGKETVAWLFLAFAAIFSALLMLPSIRRDRLAFWPARMAMLMVMAVLLFPLPHFARQTITIGPLSERNIFDRQLQLARFARDYVQAPIAVNDLVDQKNTNLTMVSDSWILPAVGPGWSKIGYLKIRGQRYSVAGSWVSFYATNQAAVPELQRLMRAFQLILATPEMLEILDPAEPFIPEPEVTQ